MHREPRPEADTSPAAPAAPPLPDLAEAREIVVFGASGGAPLARALAEAGPAARVTLVVLDPHGFLETLSRDDRSPLLDDGRLRLAAGTLRSIVAALPRASGPEIAVLVEPGVLGRTAPSLSPLAEMARELLAVQGSWLRQSLTVIANVERNLAAILAAPPVARLRPWIAGAPVLLIGPGPSLERSLDLLAERLPGRAIAAVALDTALPALHEAGVPVDLAVTLDGTERGRAKIERCRRLPPTVLFEGARPEAAERAEGCLFACERDGLLDRAHPLFGREGRYRSQGSVLLAALDLLLICGAGPIFLAGVDLALTGGRTHAGGARAGGSMTVPGKDGHPLPTTESLWRHRRRLLRRVAGLPAGRVVDVTPAGASLPGLARADLADVLAEAPALEGPDRPLRPSAADLAARGAGYDDEEREQARAAARRAIDEARARWGRAAGRSEGAD